MKKSLRYLSVLAALCFSLVAGAQETTTVNYCPNDPGDDMKQLLLSESSIVQVQSAIVIPAERLLPLKGAKITKIRFYADEGMTGTYAWIKGSLTSVVLGSPVRIGTTVQGWNEAVLSKPFEITGRELVIGYEGSVPAGKFIYSAGKSGKESYVNVNKQGWQDIFSLNVGQLCIQAVVEAPAGMKLDDIALLPVQLKKKIQLMGEAAEAEVNVANYGSQEISVPTVSYEIGGTRYEIPGEGTLAPNEYKTLSLSVSTDDCVEGENLLNVSFESEDSYRENNLQSAVIACASELYPRKMLIEHFTTLKCPNCPNGHKMLKYLTEGRNDCVWVAHHVGYGTDELTQTASNNLIQPLGVGGAPTAVFSRKMIELSESASRPAFSIGYTSPRAAAEMIKPIVDAIVNEQSCVSIHIANDYDEASSTLTTTVSGKRNAVFATFYPETNLSVQIIENAVETRETQSGSGETIHDHVFRAKLTSSIFGEEIEWDGDNFTRTFTYSIEPGLNYNPENMKVVAFVAPPYTGDGTKMEVANANELAFLESETAGIGDVVVEETNVLKREYFNLQGRRIQKPAEGLYIERVYTPEGVRSYKRVR